jgi:hypothetical protein
VILIEKSDVETGAASIWINIEGNGYYPDLLYWLIKIRETHCTR